MGWRDRDYSSTDYRETRFSPGGLRRPPNATLVLMILHGAALLLMLAMHAGDGQSVAQMLALSGASAHVLGVFLHPIATTSLLSAAFVVLTLWGLAGRLEPRLGSQRIVLLYIVANVAGGAAYFLIARLAAAVAGAPLDYPVGALAALCLLATRRLREDSVQVFGRMTNMGRVCAICGLIVIGLAVVMNGLGALAWLAAAAVGTASGVVMERMPALAMPKRRPRVRPSIRRPNGGLPPIEQPEVDDILAKISREGLDALTDAERQRLEAVRRAKLEQSNRRS